MAEQTIILPPNGPGNGGEANYRVTVFAPKRRFFSYLLDRWWVVLICLLLSVGAAVTWDTIRPETFVSFAELHVTGDVQLGMGGLFNEEAQTYYGTQIELLKSPRLQGAALAKAGGTAGPDGSSPVKFDVVQPMRTAILQLRATSPDRMLAQRFLRALIDEYTDYKKDTRANTSGELALQLRKELSAQEKVLQAEKDTFVEFQKSNNVAVIEEESKSAGLYIGEKKLQLAKLRLEHSLLTNGISPTTGPAATSTTTNAAAGESAAANPAGATGDMALNSAKARLTVLLAEKARVLERMHLTAAPANLVMAPGELKAVLEDLANQSNFVAALEEQNQAQLQKETADRDKLMAAIEADMPSWEERVHDLNDRLSQSQRLRNNIQREQAYYDRLATMLQNVAFGQNVQQERVSELQAPTPAQPNKRYLLLWIVLAVAAGAGVGTGIVFLWHLLDDRFASIRDLKEQFGEMVLGLVPRIRVRRSRPREALLKEGDARHAYVESFRHLRSALLLAPSAKGRAKTLLFTGAASGEGKSTVSANLAQTLARSGLRVALIDADPRGGGLHKSFDQPEDPGILDCLRGEVDARAVIRPTATPGLSFVARGAVHHETEGLFLRPQLDRLLHTLRLEQDYVILDGPPILSADDAALLVPHADSVIVVVRPSYTRSGQLRHVLDMLYQRKAKEVLMVFNQARAEDLAGRYARNGHSQPHKNGQPPTAMKPRHPLPPPALTPPAGPK